MTSVKKLTVLEMRRIEQQEGLTLNQGASTPLFLVGKVGLHSLAFEIDSGSDRCIISCSEARRLGVEVKKFEQAKTVVGVGGVKLNCEDYCIISIRVRLVNGLDIKLNFCCYVLGVGVPCLLGSDVLGHLGAKLCYEEKSMVVNGCVVKLIDSRVEVEKILGRNRPQKIYFSSVSHVNLPACSAREIAIELSSEVFPDDRFALIGFDGNDTVVVDTLYEGKMDNYSIGVYNKLHVPSSIKSGQRLGFMLVESENTSLHTLKEFLGFGGKFSKYPGGMTDLGSEEASMDEVLGTVKDSGEKGEGEKGEKGEGEKEEKEEGEKGEGIQDFPDRRKLSVKELNTFFDHGARVKLPTLQSELIEDKTGLDNISEKVERERSKGCTAWKDKEEFLSKFKWKEMIEELEGDVGGEESRKFAEELKELFWDFRAVFWNGSWGDWSRANITDLEIELIEGCTPAINKFRRLSPEKEKLLEGFVDDLLQAGILEPATGMAQFAANPHIVSQMRPTNSGPKLKTRFCTDFRRQNDRIKDLSYKLKLMDDLLRCASTNGKYFISFDLTNYYFLLPISPKSREITAFYGGVRGLMQYTTLPQGIKSSPALSQSVTDRVVRNCLRMLGYIDDFLGWGGTLKEMRVTIERFFVAVSHFRLLIATHKVNLVSKKVDFLGYAISMNSLIRLQSGKVTDLRDLRSPHDRASLRSYLGLMAWYSNRAPLRDALKDMRKLAKPGVKFEWKGILESRLKFCWIQFRIV